jgi:hypothetical protein
MTILGRSLGYGSGFGFGIVTVVLTFGKLHLSGRAGVVYVTQKANYLQTAFPLANGSMCLFQAYTDFVCPCMKQRLPQQEKQGKDRPDYASLRFYSRAASQYLRMLARRAQTPKVQT